ncbi:class 3 adenylate cyclase [Agrococcus sp. UYP33]
MPFYERIADADHVLPEGVPISHLYVVASLELSVTDGRGTSLALRLHSYPSTLRHEGYWAPPNLQYHVNQKYEAPQNVDEIVAHFHRYVRDHAERMLEDVTLLAESFGLRGAVIGRVAEDLLIELKPSINQPTKTNAFCTVRFALEDLRERSEANLVDREGRHGFVLLPLDGDAKAELISERPDVNGTGILSLYFLGKPLISGLGYILRDRVRVGEIRRRAINVEDEATRLEQTGIVAVADIAGYGRVLTSKYHGILAEANSERRRYQALVLAALETALTATGTTQVQTAGDGFVAGYPTGEGMLPAETLLNVISQWTTTVRLVEEINTKLANASNDSRLGSRIALNYGEYEWGRINGISSFSPAFNGTAVVDTARLEQGLNIHVAELIQSGELDGPQHVLVLSSAFSDVIDADALEAALSEIIAQGWEDCGTISLRAKERKIDGARLFHWASVPSAN